MNNIAKKVFETDEPIQTPILTNEVIQQNNEILSYLENHMNEKHLNIYIKRWYDLVLGIKYKIVTMKMLLDKFGTEYDDLLVKCFDWSEAKQNMKIFEANKTLNNLVKSGHIEIVDNREYN